LSTITTLGSITGSNSIPNVNFGYNAPNGTYSIGNEVYYDWNGNGVRDSEDEVIPGVGLWLLNAGGTRIATFKAMSARELSLLRYLNGVYTVKSMFPHCLAFINQAIPTKAAQPAELATA
jgi:hypothetical protein